MPKIALIIVGVLGIVVISVLAISYVANMLFEKKVNKEIQRFYNANVEKTSHKDIIMPEDLHGLPLSVQKWLENSQVIGKERIISARSQQKAIMRMKTDNPWMPLEAEQHFTVDKPGYIWKAKVKVAPLINIVARDKYDDGKGNVLIKLMALITIANGKGKEIDQGSLVRYLAETVWMPTAALSNYITWEEVDADSAKATMSYAGVTASGVFTFNDSGEVVSFVAQRYGDFDGQYSMETWAINLTDHKVFNGIKAPAKGEVIWKLKTGDFNWYQFEVTEIEYNEGNTGSGT